MSWSRMSKAFMGRKWRMGMVKRVPTCGRQPRKGCQSMNGVRRDSHRAGGQTQGIRIQAGEKGYMGQQAT